MSCEGWGVGDRCRARRAMTVQELQVGGPALQSTIQKDDEGTVRQKFAQRHQLAVFWDRLRKLLVLDHEQIHNLDKIP